LNLLDLTRFAGYFFRHDPSPCLVFIPIQGYSTQAYGVCPETLFYGDSGLLFLNAPDPKVKAAVLERLGNYRMPFRHL
jgi:hypothetical protein